MDVSKLINYVTNTYKLSLTGADPVNFHNLSHMLRTELNIDPTNIFSGQKRLVIENGNTVYKVVSAMDGLQDNINGLLTSNRLRELVSQNVIAEGMLKSFTLYDKVGPDAFIVSSRRVNRLAETESYYNWYEQNKDLMSTEKIYNNNEFIARYILTDPKLSVQHVAILELLSKHFVASDVFVAVTPENYGLDDDGNLVLLDLGSILPAYNSVPVVCHSCGRPKYLAVPKDTTGNLATSDTLASFHQGIYLCSSNDCDYGPNGDNMISQRAHTNVVDSIVFDEYFKKLLKQPEYILDVATVASLYIPNGYVGNINDYMIDFENTTSFRFNYDIFEALYKNSSLVFLSGYYNEFLRRINLSEIIKNNSDVLYNFNTFVSMCNDTLVSTQLAKREIVNDSTMNMLKTLIYLKLHIDLSKDKAKAVNINSIITAPTRQIFVSYMMVLDTISSAYYPNISFNLGMNI